jgi:beta-mannanase
MKVGIYRLHHETLDEAALATIETAYQTPIHIISVYRAWNRCEIEDDLPWLEQLKGLPRDILLTWEPWQIPASPDKPFEQPSFSLKTIISGSYDNYIRAFARRLAEFPRSVYLRPLHEMNGNWYPWCGTVNGNTPEDFADAWRHIRNIVTAEVASGIKWVWSPYAHSYPMEPFNGIDRYFPGDALIDWVAIDGYNWGTSMNWSTWQSFEEIFSDAYETAITMSRRPVMIAETASSEVGGSKEQWITDAFRVLKTRFQKVEILVWFDISKECDWRIASSQGSLKAFRASAQSF